MKEVRFEKQETGMRIPRPPPLPRHPRFWAPKTAIHSVTNQEIAKFWKQKHIEEEDHFLAAIKAAARVRARNLSEEEYKQFEASLKDDNDGDGDTKNGASAFYISDGDAKNKSEVRIGIKDWWTKSKYAYLNQPAVEPKAPPKTRTYNNYIPNHFTSNSPQLTFSRSVFVGLSSLYTPPDLESMYF